MVDKNKYNGIWWNIDGTNKLDDLAYFLFLKKNNDVNYNDYNYTQRGFMLSPFINKRFYKDAEKCFRIYALKFLYENGKNMWQL